MPVHRSLPIRSLAAAIVAALALPATAAAGDTTAPPAPTGLRATSPTRVAPAISWNASVGAAEYRVFRGATYLGATTSLRFVDTALVGSPSGEYVYAVKAADAARNVSAYSAKLRVRYDVTPPTAVGSLRGEPLFLPAGASLSWTAAADPAPASGVRRYVVRRAGVLVGSTTETAFADRSVAAPGRYAYTVAAEDAAGNQGPVARVTVVVGGPGAPVDVHPLRPATAVGPALAWSPPAIVGTDVAAYRVLRDGVAVATTTATAWTDPAALADGTYRYRVVALDAAGLESPASADAAVMVDRAAPAAPISVSAAGTWAYPPSLRWAAAGDVGAGVERYVVQREGVPVGETADTAFVDGALAVDGTYTYTVVAVDRAGNRSPASPAVTVRFAPAAGGPVWTGVSSRLSTDDAVTNHRYFPTMKLESPFFQWRDVERERGVYDWGRLEADIADARANGYRLIVRVAAGANAPRWIYTDPANPVTRLDLLSTEPANPTDPGEIAVPLPWDPDLAVHYRRLMADLNDHLLRFGDETRTWRLGDYVLHVPVSMPTEVGTEMPMQFGGGMSYTGTYRGVFGTYDRGEVNRAEWLRYATGARPIDQVKDLWAKMRGAWETAIATQMEALTAAPSSVAYGMIFGDQYEVSKAIATTQPARYGAGLWAMTTNLQPKMNADGTLGSWASWHPGAAESIRNAMAGGSPVGFQTAAADIVDTCAEMRFVIDEAIADYGARFIETSHRQIAMCEGLLLTGPDHVQARLAARWGG